MKWLIKLKNWFSSNRDLSLCKNIVWFFNHKVDAAASKELMDELAKYGTSSFNYDLVRKLFARDIVNLNKMQPFRETQLRFLVRQADSFYKKQM